MRNVFLWLWQFPQNVIGFIWSRFGCKVYLFDNTVYLVPFCFNCCVSLGDYIIADRRIIVDVKTIRHEAGHKTQSHYLGFLYLFSVGIVSMCRNVYDRLFHRNWSIKKRIAWYYGSWPENWADDLGGVKR